MTELTEVPESVAEYWAAHELSENPIDDTYTSGAGQRQSVDAYGGSSRYKGHDAFFIGINTDDVFYTDVALTPAGARNLRSRLDAWLAEVDA